MILTDPHMNKIGLFFFLTIFARLASAQVGSEIYLFDLTEKKGKISLSTPINITNHKGYDNQPFFHPDLPVVYYTSANEDGRTDIMSYNYKVKQTKPITQTPEKEYSPTVTLDKQYLSCIIQRDNGAQDLGKYPIDGGEPFVIIDKMTVGYHVWADNSHLGLFILGTPNTLHYLLLPIKRDTILAQDIGRSLHKVPGENAISFVHKVSEKEWWIKKFNTYTKKIVLIGTTVSGSEDLCWLPNGKILMSDGPKIYSFTPGSGPGWNEVTVTSGAGLLKGVTRMAVSADGKKLAVVVVE